MYKIIVFTHGELSRSLKETAELISGPAENVETYGITLGCDTNMVLEDVKVSIETASKNNLPVLVLTDLYFGTPFNLLMSLMSSHNFSHVTGVNLPMLLEAISMQDDDIPMDDLAADLTEKGKEAIVDCNKFAQALLANKEK